MPRLDPPVAGRHPPLSHQPIKYKEDVLHRSIICEIHGTQKIGTHRSRSIGTRQSIRERTSIHQRQLEISTLAYINPGTSFIGTRLRWNTLTQEMGTYLVLFCQPTGDTCRLYAQNEKIGQARLFWTLRRPCIIPVRQKWPKTELLSSEFPPPPLRPLRPTRLGANPSLPVYNYHDMRAET